jgi:hypothetical protein
MSAFLSLRSLFACLRRRNFPRSVKSGITPILASLSCFLLLSGALRAESSRTTRLDSTQGYSTESAKQMAVAALPLEKLDAQGRMKVRSVLMNLTLFRRMPVRIIDCDPDLYMFLLKHPDVMVNIWNELRISQLQLKELGPNRYRMIEPSGTTADLELIYQSHDVQLLYAEGVYQGTFTRTVRGRALFLLKSGYIRDTDDRYYISSRLDLFLSVEPGAVEWVTKTLQPIIGKIADNNFSQTVAFVGSLSRTTELNSRGVQRLASRLGNVSPRVRDEFFLLTGKIALKPPAVALRRTFEDLEVARKKEKQSTWQ